MLSVKTSHLHLHLNEKLVFIVVSCLVKDFMSLKMLVFFIFFGYLPNFEILYVNCHIITSRRGISGVDRLLNLTLLTFLAKKLFVLTTATPFYR